MYLPIHETINEFTSTYDQTLTFQNNSGWAQIDERPKQYRRENIRDCQTDKRIECRNFKLCDAGKKDQKSKCNRSFIQNES